MVIKCFCLSQQSAQKGTVKTEKKGCKKESLIKNSRKTTVKKETKQESVSNTAPKKGWHTG